MRSGMVSNSMEHRIDVCVKRIEQKESKKTKGEQADDRMSLGIFVRFADWFATLGFSRGRFQWDPACTSCSLPCFASVQKLARSTV